MPVSRTATVTPEPLTPFAHIDFAPVTDVNTPDG